MSALNCALLSGGRNCPRTRSFAASAQQSIPAYSGSSPVPVWLLHATAAPPSIKCSDRDQQVSQLSGGNKQKVVFGKWIGRGSDILILDCPTRGVDIGVKRAMYQLMVQLKNEGKSILMISEEMPELMGMSDRLIIMKDGKIMKEFLRSADLSDTEIIKYMI